MQETLLEDDLVHEGMGLLRMSNAYALGTGGELVTPNMFTFGGEGGVGDATADIAHGDEFGGAFRDGHRDIQRSLGAEIGSGDIRITNAAGIRSLSFCRGADAEQGNLDVLSRIASVGQTKRGYATVR